jgi:hypothetical protein
MSVNYDIPFYANTPDDTHCVQAVFKMIAEHFRPDLTHSFEEWDVISHKKQGGWTWPMSSLMWLKEQGFDVVNIEDFDYDRFSKEGLAYLATLWGQELADIQAEKTNVPAEQEIAKRFAREIDTERRAPILKDVRSLLDDGYLVSLSVNLRILNGQEGYVGHLVVVRGYDESGVFLNDPGLPPVENRHVDTELFMRAWAYPDEKALNLAALRKKHHVS